jgi:flagellar basal body rod protein FlgG
MIEEPIVEENQGGEEEVVYQLDEEGYLMDEKGNYILDDNGNMIKLSNEHIEYLRAADMLEEEVK